MAFYKFLFESQLNFIHFLVEVIITETISEFFFIYNACIRNKLILQIFGGRGGIDDQVKQWNEKPSPEK